MNAFDDPDGTFVVPVNDEERRSPAGLAVPAGWQLLDGEGSRQSSLDYIEARTGLRARSARHDPVPTG
jgi:MbtH protein